MQWRVPATICLMILFGLVGFGISSADSSYSISAADTVDVPSETIEFENDSFTISEVGYVEFDGDLTVAADGPSGQHYDIYLYNFDRDIVTTDGGESGTTTTTFDMGSLGADAGTYFLVINADGEREALHPVVVNGYDISYSVPDSATVGDEVTVTINLSQKDGVDEPVRSVELVVVVDGEERHLTATESDDGSYTATIDANVMGTYRVYVGVRGNNKAEGEYELISISTPAYMDVTEESTATESPTPTDEDDGGGQSTDTATDSPTPTETTAPPTTTAPKTPTTSTSVTTEPSASPTPTTDDVVTPAPSATPSPPPTTKTTSPVGLPTIGAMLLGGLGLWRLRDVL